jgi:hypothetical protein
VVDEDVLATAVLRDEAKALRVIEPLHDTTGHLQLTSFVLRSGYFPIVPVPHTARDAGN